MTDFLGSFFCCLKCCLLLLTLCWSLFARCQSNIEEDRTDVKGSWDIKHVPGGRLGCGPLRGRLGREMRFFHGDRGNPLLYFLACILAMWWTALPHFKLPATIHCIFTELKATEASYHGMKALELCNKINLQFSALQAFLGLHLSYGIHGSIWTLGHGYAQPFDIMTQYCLVQSWC